MRWVASLTAAIFLLAPAVAGAGKDSGLPWEDDAAALKHVTFSGSVEQAGRPGIEVRLAVGRSGGPQYLLKLRTEPIEAVCPDDSVRRTRIKSWARAFPLRYGRYWSEQGGAFHGLTYTLSGRAAKTKVRGHLRVSGHGCSSGSLRWHTRLRPHR
jgi:hypothetical protein